MEISFCSHPNTNKVIATIFGTWHDSWAVVACAKFCCDVIISNWIRAKWNFHHIWIVMEKSLVKWVPESEQFWTRSVTLWFDYIENAELIKCHIRKWCILIKDIENEKQGNLFMGVLPVFRSNCHLLVWANIVNAEISFQSNTWGGNYL